MPDVPLNRQCIRELQIRIAERIGRNDVDGAWYDIMSVLHFSRHYIAKTNGVEKLIGIAVERIAAQSIKLLLQKGNPSKEQLAKFAADLDSLPNRWQSEYFNIEFERMSVYSCLFYCVGANEADDSGSEKEYIVWKAKTL
ncbi:hypothetical protein FACS18942_06360 [Planctomycetales bacterium]|nr:hypothetical protein FACS18942_06360 [Planctomycetales bacterium]